MPWCEPCERFFNPNSLTEEGACPSCGIELGLGAAKPKFVTNAPTSKPSATEASTTEAPASKSSTTKAPASKSSAAKAPTKAPWHFKLLVVATAGYVGWRVVQLVVRGLEALF